MWLPVHLRHAELIAVLLRHQLKSVATLKYSKEHPPL